jgi:hypothetical protein
MLITIELFSLQTTGDMLLASVFPFAQDVREC